MISAGNSAEQTKLSANLLSKLVEHLLLMKIAQSDCLSFLVGVAKYSKWFVLNTFSEKFQAEVRYTEEYFFIFTLSPLHH